MATIIIQDFQTMSNKIVPHTDNQLAPVESFYEYAQAQNDSAKRGLFAEYREKKSQSTLYAHDKDLGLFVDFVHSSGGIVFNEEIPATHNAKGDVDGCPCQRCSLARGLRDFAEAWNDVSHGMVFNFRDWLKAEGYSIKSINRRLSTVKIYAALAFQSGVLSESDHVYIRSIKGYTSKDGKKIDEKRERSRISSKKAKPTEIPDAMVQKLKQNHDWQTKQGIRDALLMTMLLDTGMRCSELEAFKVENILILAPMPAAEDFETTAEHRAALEAAAAQSMIQFYRLKTSEWSPELPMTPDLFEVIHKYKNGGLMPEDMKAPLLRSSHKSGKLNEPKRNADGTYKPGMSSRAIYNRVKEIGVDCGIFNVSPHDFRHSAAKRTAKKVNGNTMDLMNIFGWATPTMATHYGKSRVVANIGQI